MARRIDDALGAGGALAALAGPGRRAMLAGGQHARTRPGTRDLLARAERHAPQIDRAAVESLADLLTAQRRADDALGSAVMLQPALAQARAVENLVRSARAPARRALLDIAQQWAQFGGCLCRNTAASSRPRSRSATHSTGRQSSATGP